MKDLCAAGNMISHEQALSELLDFIEPVNEIEDVSITTAVGRTLATDILSKIDVPPHNNSAMDGFAFALPTDILTGTKDFDLIGASLAGQPFQGSVEQGQCVRIMTGAMIPEGCDTVQMQECCQVNGNQISIQLPSKRGNNVRIAGEDIFIAQCVFKKGRQLNAADIGVLASIGVASVAVVRKINVAILSTGDELTPIDQPLRKGAIYESNSYALTAFFQQCQCRVINMGVIADEPLAIEKAFLAADKVADIVVSTGGVSVGDADYTKDVLANIGNIAFWKVAIKPGKPFSCGQLPSSIFFGLPGNPVSAFVTTDKLVLPALRKLQGQGACLPFTLRAKTTQAIKKHPGRKEFQRANLHQNERGEWLVTAIDNQGSGVMTSVAYGDCYIVLPAAQANVAQGESVNVELYESHLR